MDCKDLGKCPVCWCEEVQPYSVCTDFMVSRSHFALVRCPECGVVYTLDHPLEESMKDYDKLALRLKLGDNPKGLLHKLYYYTRAIMLQRKAMIVERQAYRGHGSLLNYGAKTGYFSSYMENRGWNVTSVEKDHEERVFSLEMFHHRMIDLDEMELLTPQSFDVITLWHVFEHNQNPGQLLDRFYELLRDNGILLIACPNIKSTDSFYYGPYWAAYDVPRHLWHFCPTSLCRLAAMHGYTLMHHQALPFDSFYISILSEKHMGHSFPFLRGMYVGLKSWWIALGNKGKASSIVYVFKKK